MAVPLSPIGWWHNARARRLASQVESAALVDGDFAAPGAREAALALYGRLAGRQRPWAHVLKELLGRDAAGWCEFTGAAPGSTVEARLRRLDLVRVLDRGEAGTPRVVFRVESSLSVSGGIGSEEHTTRVYWTLARKSSDWELVAVEDEHNGKRHLKQLPSETPELDVARLHDREVLESATTNIPEGELEARYVNGEHACHELILDLSLVDDRFAPPVIECSARRLLAAWEEATNGRPDALEGLASKSSIDRILLPERGLPRSLREPRIRELKVVQVDTERTPASIAALGTIRAYPDMWHYDFCWKLELRAAFGTPWLLIDPNAWDPAYALGQ
jgi:hypothetical protein